MDLREAYRNEGTISREVFATEDAKEGPRAFAEKRSPRWTGR
jgi:enoyl-CoA hydratase